MGDTKFRDAKPEPTKEQADKVETIKDEDRVGVSDDTTEPPIVHYQEIKGLPYTAEFFKIQGIWDNPDLSYQEDIAVIENYYREQVQQGKLEDGSKGYQELIRIGEKATDSKNSPADVKIAKLAEFFKFMSRLKDVDKIKNRYGI